MSRHKKPVETGIEIEHDEASLARAEGAAVEIVQMRAGYAQERDLVNQLLGQAQMAEAISKLTATVSVSKMAFVKENKLYRQLAGAQNRDGRGLNGTWEEFCELLGTSAPKVNEDITNLHSFGEQALESMSRMGIGYRELRQYRRLDGDQQQLLIEAAKTGDKAEFLDLAEELIAKHAAEKAALASENENLKAEAAATQAVLDGKNKRIDKLEREQARLASAPPDEQLAEDLKALAERAHRALAIVRGDLRLGFVAIFEREAQGPDAPSHRHVLAGYLDELEREIAILRNDFHLAAVRA